jgi:hypothetical protein
MGIWTAGSQGNGWATEAAAPMDNSEAESRDIKEYFTILTAFAKDRSWAPQPGLIEQD